MCVSEGRQIALFSLEFCYQFFSVRKFEFHIQKEVQFLELTRFQELGSYIMFDELKTAMYMNNVDLFAIPEAAAETDHICYKTLLPIKKKKKKKKLVLY